MKLATALAERADLDKRFGQLKERIKASARYTEGEDAPEDAVELLNEAQHVLMAREQLVARINLTNAVTYIDMSTIDPDMPRVTVTDAIAMRDRFHAEQRFLGEMADAAGGYQDFRYGGRRRSELPMRTDLNIAEMRRDADKAAKNYRLVDQLIQAVNWSTELS